MDALFAAKEAVSKRSKANKETINYKDALLYGYEQVLKNEAITINDIVKINNIITEQGIFFPCFVHHDK